MESVSELGSVLSEKFSVPEENMVVEGEDTSDAIIEEFAERYSISNIQQNVAAIVHLWGKINPMAPYEFFSKLLISRGYEPAYFQAPSKKKSEQPNTCYCYCN